jgi:hypothetical protein
MTQFPIALLPFAVLALLWIVLMGYLQRRRANDLAAGRSESRAESLESPDGWSPKGAIHTYRDAEAFTGKAVSPRTLIACFVFLLFGSQVAIHPGVTWFNAFLLAFCVGGPPLPGRKARRDAAHEGLS